MTARPSPRQRASASAARIAAADPIANPPSASFKVNTPALQIVPQLSRRVSRMLESGGSRNSSTPRPRVNPSQAAIPSTKTAAAGPQSESLRSVPLTRSEEHTSELQSRGHLVCRLLLEKKKTNEPRLLIFKNKRNKSEVFMHIEKV